MVIEGPSGIGKTTTVTKALADLKIADKILSLSARQTADVEMIAALPEMKDIGTVIVDDFHRLPDRIKERLSDFMKVLADAETPTSKLILIGINKAGLQLVKFAHDLGMRIDVFRLEANPQDKIEELITLGEGALKIEISQKPQIAQRAQGSFQIAQVLSHKLCVLSKVIETLPELRILDLPIDVVVEDVMVDFARQFKEPAMVFARGSKLRREGRAISTHLALAGRKRRMVPRSF
jgi:Holliday junction resolvasome RuvABC ATP-dependent DNA helicase subunit